MGRRDRDGADDDGLLVGGVWHGQRRLDLLQQRDTWRVADLDGQPPNDVLVQHGGTFRMWYGGAATGIDRDPDQVLKSSGNVLHTLVRDVLGDERPELQVIRGEKLSVGDIVRWLVVAGSLDFDVFTYANEGAGLSRKPARRSRISIEIPGLLELMDDAEGLGETMQERLETPARRLDLDGDGAVDDVVDVLDGHVVYYRDVVPEDFPTSLIESESLEPERSLDRLIELFILEDLDSLGDGATRTIQLEDAMDLDVTPGWRLRQLVAGTTPERRFKTPLLEPRLTPTDVDGDGVSDVVLRGHLEGDVQAVQVLISLP